MIKLRNERGRLISVEEPRAKQLLATGNYTKAEEGEPIYDPAADKSVPKAPPKASTPLPEVLTAPKPAPKRVRKPAAKKTTS
jgi:hypothetical protein